MQRPVDESEPFYVARIGPIALASRAHEIAAELTQAGLEATINRRDGDIVYQVLSEALAPGPAERRLASLTALGYRPQLRMLPGGLAQIVIATSSAKVGAESLARRIRSQGYFAQVAAEGGSVHMITVGPYRRSAVDAIVRRVRARFGSVPVVVDQVE
jgi:hypothetical protein